MKKQYHKMTRLEKKREASEHAMPEVKKLVKKYGRTNVQYCINQLKDYERKCKQLEELKKEAEKLEREIK